MNSYEEEISCSQKSGQHSPLPADVTDLHDVANSEIFGGKNSHGYLSRDLEATTMITRVAA